MKTCEIPDSRSLENRGMAWMIGAFIFCPCHLPITLAALALILGGTAAGALLRAHPYLAGTAVTLLWAAGTWRGYRLIKRAKTIADLRSRIAD
ncbi:MAG TPA: hypothetical protein VFZ38_21840 [Vicinamibacterales bacterium]